MAHRVFGPRPAKRKPAPEKSAEHDVSPIAEKLATDLGQDAETAQRNAQNIAQVLKRALKPEKSAKLDVGPIVEKITKDLGQDTETAEKNAQHIAEVLKRALKRRKISNTSHR
jgi:uncharacterized protein (DUF2267 family)